MRTRATIGALAGLAALGIGGVARGQEPLPVATAELEALLVGLVTSARAEGRLGPAAFVVVGDGTVLFQRGFGVENLETNEPVDPERSLFLAASIGKLFVATAAAQLAAEGRLALATPVGDLLACADVGARAVSVEALLTHQSGIEERMLGSLLPSAGPPPELADYFARHPPRFVRPAGRALCYSNLGVALAGLMVERASGLSFCDYVEQHIFVPLAMQHSSFRQPLPEEFARHLVRESRGLPPRIAPYPSGSLVATPADMARFLLAHLGDGATADGRILSATSARDMRRRRFGARPEVPGVALGFFESFVNGQRALFHTGDRGHHSILWFLPEERVGFYLVYGARDENSSAFRERFTQAFADQVVPAAPFVLPAPADDALASALRYSGRYRFEAGSPGTIEALSVAANEIHIVSGPQGELHAEVGFGGPSLRLVEVAPGLCRSEDGAYLAFTSGADGRGARLDISGGIGDPFGAERIGTLERGPLHALVLLATLALFGLRALWAVLALCLRLVGRRPPAPQESGPCTLAWRVSGWTSALLLILPVLVLAWLLSRPFPLIGVPWILPAATTLLLVASVLALLQVGLTLRAWLRRDGPLGRRAWLGLAALGTLASLPVLAYWNLLGYRF